MLLLAATLKQVQYHTEYLAPLGFAGVWLSSTVYQHILFPLLPIIKTLNYYGLAHFHFLRLQTYFIQKLLL